MSTRSQARRPTTSPSATSKPFAPPVRSTALFNDDFTADNKIQLNAKFAGKSTIKFNAVANTKVKDHEVQYNLHDDAQIDGTGFGFGFQTKFKPNVITLQTDLGMFHRLHVSKDGSETSLWNNPYLFFEISRKLRFNSFFIGNVFHLNNWFRNNFRINVWEKFAGNKGLNLENNMLAKWQGFVFSNFVRLEHSAEKSKVDERFLLGYEHLDHSAALTL